MLGVSHSVEVALLAGSVVMFVGTMIAVPIFLVKIRDDYFVRERKKQPLALTILRTVVGLGLVALGIAMIVLPGQGLLTILVGLSILDLPIKDRMINKVLCHPKVHGAIDRLRRKAGKGSLQVPGTCAAHSNAAEA